MGGDGLFPLPLPTIFFVITLITANYMVLNTWTFPIYILFKFRNKEISQIPLAGLLEKVVIYFSKIDNRFLKVTIYLYCRIVLY